MNIGGTSPVNGPQNIYPKPPERRPAPPATTTPAGDSVEISDAARLSEAIARLPDVRADKVAQAREMIANGTLDTPEHMDAALNAMLQDMLGMMEAE